MTGVKKNRILGGVLLLVLLLGCLPQTAYAADSSNYTYDYWGQEQKSSPAFALAYTIDAKSQGVDFLGIDDVATSSDRVFLVDTKDSRVHVLDREYQYVTSIKLIRTENKKIALDEDGNQIKLTSPEGIWYHAQENEIYIADTGAERIIVLDGEGYFLKRIITKPENMVGVTQFQPSKIAVDKTNKIYFVVNGGYEGIVELNPDGSFSRYFGVNKPTVDIFDYFWKLISSEEQKEKMEKTYAPSFVNLTIDEDGFVYATSVDSSAQQRVFRLNPKGENVLRQAGYIPVDGDLQTENSFIDVAINEYGVYALLCQTTGRIFLYNFDGELINIFGKTGNLKGDSKSPSSIAWFGDALIVTDKVLQCAYVYEMTEFGEAALGATKAYYNGEWETSVELFRKALDLNANFDLAYVGIGKYYLMQDAYKDAMYYLKLGNEKVYYSKAYNGQRSLWIQDHFVWIILVLAGAGGWLIYSEIRYHRKRG